MISMSKPGSINLFLSARGEQITSKGKPVKSVHVHGDQEVATQILEETFSSRFFRKIPLIGWAYIMMIDYLKDHDSHGLEGRNYYFIER